MKTPINKIESTTHNGLPIVNNNISIGKSCVFPDGSQFPIQSILDVDYNYSQICYFDGGLAQILWVPTQFIQND